MFSVNFHVTFVPDEFCWRYPGVLLAFSQIKYGRVAFFTLAYVLLIPELS